MLNTRAQNVISATWSPNGEALGTVDLTKADNFHLIAAGVNRKTGVAFRGTATWTVSSAACMVSLAGSSSTRPAMPMWRTRSGRRTRTR